MNNANTLHFCEGIQKKRPQNIHMSKSCQVVASWLSAFVVPAAAPAAAPGRHAQLNQITSSALAAFSQSQLAVEFQLQG